MLNLSRLSQLIASVTITNETGNIASAGSQIKADDESKEGELIRENNVDQQDITNSNRNNITGGLDNIKEGIVEDEDTILDGSSDSSPKIADDASKQETHVNESNFDDKDIAKDNNIVNSTISDNNASDNS